MRKTNLGLVLVALTLLVASTAAAGINRHGTVTPINQAIFHIDTPIPGGNVFGIVDVRGYVLDLQRGVSQITLLIDDVAVHDADINLARTDVRRKYPAFDGGELDSGFATSFLARNFSSGQHTLAIRVRYTNGDEEKLGTRAINVDNARYQGPIGVIDQPRATDDGITSTDYVTGVYPLTGWVLDDVGVSKRLSPTGCTGAPSPTCRWLADIEVMVDGRTLGESIYYLPRPDAANAHPDVPGAFNSGFQMNIDTTRIDNGQHTLSVRAWDNDPGGKHSAIIGSRVIWVDNNYATLSPFGHIDFPMNDGNFYSCSCNAQGVPVSGISQEYAPTDHIDWLSGWVIDQNNDPIREGIKNVELLFDGAIYKSTWTDCSQVCIGSHTFNANCYGLAERMDIEYRFPQFIDDAKVSGFFFAVDTDWCLRNGRLHKGLNYVSVRAVPIDETRPAVIIDKIPVVVRCNADGTVPAFGELEAPEVMQDMQGATNSIHGWVAYQGIRYMNLYVDGVLDRTEECDGIHVCIFRTDVLVKYPWLPYMNYEYGFDLNLDTTKYVDGIHNLVLEAVHLAGYKSIWMQRLVRFDNFNR
jgi:hypothetical protein